MMKSLSFRRFHWGKMLSTALPIQVLPWLVWPVGVKASVDEAIERAKAKANV